MCAVCVYIYLIPHGFHAYVVLYVKNIGCIHVYISYTYEFLCTYLCSYQCRIHVLYTTYNLVLVLRIPSFDYIQSFLLVYLVQFPSLAIARVCLWPIVIYIVRHLTNSTVCSIGVCPDVPIYVAKGSWVTPVCTSSYVFTIYSRLFP